MSLSDANNFQNISNSSVNAIRGYDDVYIHTSTYKLLLKTSSSRARSATLVSGTFFPFVTQTTVATSSVLTESVEGFLDERDSTSYLSYGHQIKNPAGMNDSFPNRMRHPETLGSNEFG